VWENHVTFLMGIYGIIVKNRERIINRSTKGWIVSLARRSFKRFPILNPKNIRPRVKVRDMLWEFHLADDDFWPSIPHGHSLEGPYKLCLDTYNVYDIRTRKIYGRSKEKEIKKLFEDEKFCQFVVDAKRIYEERNVTKKGFSKRIRRVPIRSRRQVVTIPKGKQFIIEIQIEIE
jgi:hypothetical protein